MAVGCGAKCAKALLIVFNLIFWLSGCALLALGIWILVDNDKDALFNLIAKDGDMALMKYLAYGLVAIGGFVLIVGFVGCCGALQESKCLLGTYFAFLFVVLGAELTVGILAVIYRVQLLENLGEQLTTKLQHNYGRPEHEHLTRAIDYAQFKFNCCGIHNSAEYSNSTWIKSDHKSGTTTAVPKTCCVLSNNSTYDAFINPDPVNESDCQQDKNDFRHKIGCQESIEQWVKNESALLIGVGLGIASLEIFGMIFAICLCRSIGEEA